jgi:hypothetical protein
MPEDWLSSRRGAGQFAQTPRSVFLESRMGSRKRTIEGDQVSADALWTVGRVKDVMKQHLALLRSIFR